MYKLIYRTEDGTLGDGYIAEEVVSKLTGRDRIRIVDYPSECNDPEAGL